MTVVVDHGVDVPMRDGVRLAADVFRPAGRGRSPVVLLRTPYDRGSAPAFGTQLNALRLAADGFAVVTQDVRGRFGSEGDFYPFAQEGEDGAATIAWAAEQPWSSGAVAMAGSSYCGYAQVLAARQRPEALRGWLPAFCPLDARDHWVYAGDAFLLAFNLAWMLGSVAAGDRRTPDPAAVLAAYDDWDATVRRPVGAQPELGGAVAGAAYADWLERRDDAAWWDALSGRGAGTHDAPALVVGGWYDLFAHGTLALHDELVRGSAARVGLVLGPWDHAPLPLGSGAGDVEFGSAAAVDLPALAHAWFDHVLRDGEPPFEAAARTFVTGWNRWETWTAWPPPAAPLVLHTAPGGALTADVPAPADEGFRMTASDPVPTHGGLLYGRPRGVRSGCLDQRVRDGRDDILRFASDPVAADLMLAGPARAELWSTTTGQGADIVATLVDVAPDGRALNVAEGVRRRLDAAGEPVRFDLELGHLAHAVRRGHRLRLDVAGASFPRIDRLPAFGTCQRRLLHGGRHASRLVLPAIG